MQWYKGYTLMELLETVPVLKANDNDAMRFPVQYVIRPISDSFHDFRGYAGMIAGGVAQKGDKVVVLPGGQRTVINAVTFADKELDAVREGKSIAIQLADDIDVGRGDMIVSAEHEQPQISQTITLTVCWFNPKPMSAANRYIIRHTTRETQGIIKSIDNRINISTLQKETGVESITMNDIAEITLKTASPLVFDSYKKNRVTGSLVFIDPNTFETVGAGMIF